ncbi:Xylulose kinase [Hypsibius exemplaris]|uniref:Xylulose kinase n=1 Tax=Hypsibius exemplaris TaxID=2072580 RepID=A0A9X6NJT8_HYPEX|nr:Xylulose kinase [Hypsibius exemplaris]
MRDSLYLGLDLSTQQLKALIVGEQLEVVREETVHFDSELPEFGTQGGVCRGKRPNGEECITAPTVMWVKALDLLLQKLQRSEIPLNKIVAISGSGQQHGSVFWKSGASVAFGKHNPFKPLHEQFTGLLSVADSPVWMDSSTTAQCRKLEESVGGAEVVVSVTGSRAYERFTGPQIARLYADNEEGYDATERISLVSSFVATLFLGAYAAIDWADASGMNLMDIHRKHWDSNCLNACAPQLKHRLEKPCPPWTVLGKISKYFCQRYGFSKDCDIVACTGDNPSSLAGMNLRAGDLCISLGTSDTVFAVVTTPRPSLEGHILCSPVKEDEYMAMLCFKNGSLLREKIRLGCTDGTWEDFERKLNDTPAGNEGIMGLFFDEQEIVPHAHGIHRFDGNDEALSELSPAQEIRALVEFQAIAKRYHLQCMGFHAKPETRIFVTGGGSRNRTLLQVIANVFQCDVYTQSVTNSAAYGAACRAVHAVRGGSYFDLVHKSSGFPPVNVAVRHNASLREIYDKLTLRYGHLQALVVDRDNSGKTNGHS